MRLPFKRRADKFVTLLQQAAENLDDTAEKLAELMRDYADRDRLVEEIADLEHRGDSILHETMRQLHRTFVTALDRDEISGLAENIDDVVDHIEDAARIMRDYGIEEPTAEARELSETLVRSVAEVTEAVGMLVNVRGNRDAILERCVRINTQEEEADRIVKRALAGLFTGAGPVGETLKWREVYDQLEGAADSAEHAANVIEGIVLEHA